MPQESFAETKHVPFIIRDKTVFGHEDPSNLVTFESPMFGLRAIAASKSVPLQN